MKSAVRAHLSLTFFVIFASIGILGLYASAAHSLPTTLSKFYLGSVAGYFAGWIYLFNLTLLPTRLSRYTSWIAPLLAWAWLLFLISNYFVFKLYKYHISLLLVEMFCMLQFNFLPQTVLLVYKDRLLFLAQVKVQELIRLLL